MKFDDDLDYLLTIADVCGAGCPESQHDLPIHGRGRNFPAAQTGWPKGGPLAAWGY